MSAEYVGLGEAAKMLPAEGLLQSDGWLTIPIKDGGDFILQWGRISVDYSGEHTSYPVAGGSVSKFIGEKDFPIMFPNALLSINAAGNDVLNTYIPSVSLYSASKFTWSYHSTGAYVLNSGGGNSFCWFAIGF